MTRFIEGQDRQQVTLMPECLDDFIAGDNPVRVIDAFVGELDLTKLEFEGAEPAVFGRLRRQASCRNSQLFAWLWNSIAA